MYASPQGCASEWRGTADTKPHTLKFPLPFNDPAGSGIVTLQSVLQAYEHVLPRHGVKADEDTYYYRLLLKLSLDPALDWWIKLNRETGTTGG